MDRGIQSRALRNLAAAALLAVAVGMPVLGCGSDEEPTKAGRTAAAEDTSAAAGDVSAAASTDGRLTTTTGEVITDYGDISQRRQAVRVLDRLQREFRAGEMAAACARINDFLFSQFTPRGTRDETPCPEKLEAYAAERARRGARPQRLRLLWVRAYTGQTGVWVDDGRGERLRVQLSYSLSGDGWQLDLGSLNRPDVLDAELVGADSYGRR
jgi:hypothetical protein